MIKFIHTLILLFLLICNFDCFSQKTLEIVYTRFGRFKRFDIHVNDELIYKLKGQFVYHHNKITNLEDSVIVFSNDNSITLDQLKVLRINRGNYVIRKFQKFFIRGGIIFFLLNTINNKLNNVEPALDQKAALIAGGIVFTGLVIRELGIKRLRITKRKYLKIVDLNFDNLSVKPGTDKK